MLAVVPVYAIVLSFISSNIQPNILAQQLGMTKASKLANNVISNIITMKCCNSQDYECRKIRKRGWKSNTGQLSSVRFFALCSNIVVRPWPLVWRAPSKARRINGWNMMAAFLACLVAAKAFEKSPMILDMSLLR